MKFPRPFGIFLGVVFALCPVYAAAQQISALGQDIIDYLGEDQIATFCGKRGSLLPQIQKVLPEIMKKRAGLYARTDVQPALKDVAAHVKQTCMQKRRQTKSRRRPRSFSGRPRWQAGGDGAGHAAQ